MSTAPRRHASGKQEMASGTSFTPIGSVDDVASPETLLKVQEQRQTLIEEKRREVARVMDQHDDLVRELFHLSHFKSLVYYNPKEAKADTSDVFLKFKAKNDLLDNAPAVSSSRTTRRSRTERLQALQAVSVSAPSPSSTSSGANDSLQRLPEHGQVTHKGKGKNKAAQNPPEFVSDLRHRTKGKAKMAPVDSEELESQGSLPVTPNAVSSHSRRRSAMGPPPGPHLPHKKRKVNHTGPALNGHAGDSTSLEAPSSASTPAIQYSGRLRSSGTTARGHEPQKSVAESIAALPSTPLSPVKRIKLIVRRPHPTLSSPIQKPPSPKFGGSMTELLSSYAAPDGVDLDEKGLRELYRDDLAVWRKIDTLRRQGRMLFRPPDDMSSSAELPILPIHGDRTRGDVWDAIIDAVKARVADPPTDGRQVAAQIASQVKAYLVVKKQRDSKAKAQEEKRLRALAKATIRMVAAEWKKAVFHIREQERLRQEAEERRRGHEHLDALLDKSGQLLEAQQVDLTKGDAPRSRSRSRSSSLADALGRWASASPPPDTDRQSDHSRDDTSSERSDSDEEVAEESDSSALIDTSTLAPPRSASDDSVSVDVSRYRSLSSTPSLDMNHAEEPLHEPPTSRPHTPEFDIPRASLDTLFEKDTLQENDSLLPSSERSGFRYHSKSPTRQQVKPLSESNGRMAIKALLDHDSGLDISSSGRSSPVPPPAWSPRPPRHLEDLLNTDDAPPTTPSTVLEEELPSPHSSRKDEAELVSPPVPSLETPRESGSDAVQDDGAVSEALEPSTPLDDIDLADDEEEQDLSIPKHLRPYAVAPVEWDPQEKIKPPLLLRGNLRPYQQAGMEWLASLHTNRLNGILADEMGLGKTIQTISLLAHLACDRGIWGPHLIIVPTSVLLNWEMEFKKFLPGFKVLSYHGNTKRRKELRQGWNNKYHFNVCVTSYTLASRDAHVFKRKAWYYMILDEAHMIKNFKSQRWNILLMFRSFGRLLLTGTPLQNNLTELWALLQFLMAGSNFANLKEFADWFANPLEKAIEMGTVLDDEMQQRVAKLHNVLRPYLLRRLKRDVEKELPSKFEHLVMCPLSKRQRFLYGEFMSRAETRHDLQSGVYQKIANILMQLRKVVNHPDLFEVRPIRTSFAMSRSAIADFEIKELLVRRQLLREDDENHVNLDILGFRFVDRLNTSRVVVEERRRLDGTSHLPLIAELPAPPRADTRTIAGHKKYQAYLEQAATAARWAHIGYLNRLRCCQADPVYSEEVITLAQRFYRPLLPSSEVDRRFEPLFICDKIHQAVKSYAERAETMFEVIDRFVFVTPQVVARDLPRICLSGAEATLSHYAHDTEFDRNLHRATVKLQIAFPDPYLLQYDCGKLQELDCLLRERKAGGHRVLIFTQMTRILDILEIFLNLHGYLYLRLDGATKIEDRQYITERFNTDPRIFCFISSSRSGGVGINLTGADTVIFYDSDFNPQMDRQCEDGAHRIGQIRDVHIYRFVSAHTVEEALLRKANQKRSLDDIVIQKGEFDWRTLFGDDGTGVGTSSGITGGGIGDGPDFNVSALEKALGEFEDTEDRMAREIAAREEIELTGADEADFGDGAGRRQTQNVVDQEQDQEPEQGLDDEPGQEIQEVEGPEEEAEEDEEEGGTTVDYMLAFVQSDPDFFSEWRV